MSFELLTVRGRLSSVMDSRITKNGWEIRDFIVELDSSSRYPQPRKFQAIQDVVAYLPHIPTGAEIEVHFKMRGKRYKKELHTEYIYYNIDEVHKIILLDIIK